MVNHHALLYGDFTMFILLQQHLCLWRENIRLSIPHQTVTTGVGQEMAGKCHSTATKYNLSLYQICYCHTSATLCYIRLLSALEPVLFWKKRCVPGNCLSQTPHSWLPPFIRTVGPSLHAWQKQPISPSRCQHSKLLGFTYISHFRSGRQWPPPGRPTLAFCPDFLLTFPSRLG